MVGKNMDDARYKILLVEDNEIDQMAFRRFVENNALPYDCIVAGSVSEAQSVLDSE
jgi:CheY-like chemotaxis protein